MAADRTETLLRSLSEAAGPSGYEGDVRDLVVSQLKPITTEITYDGMGSVIARQGTSGPRIMLDAHLDEVGGLVRRVTPTGFLTMQMLGGFLDQVLPDQRWLIMTSKGPVRAISGLRDIHVTPPEERARTIPQTEIFLDVGASTPAEVAALGIEAGDPVVPDSPFAVLRGTKRYLGKAWDDRVGCAVVIEVLRRLSSDSHPNEVFGAFTVQEELGARGARSSTAQIAPDIGISIESGVTGDLPVSKPDDSQARLGGGPTVYLYAASEMPNQRLIGFIKETANRDGIPIQFDVGQGIGDDASEMQKSGRGIPVVNLGVPVRYTHAHNGIIDRADFDRTVDLIVALVKRMDAATVARIRDFGP
jgi:putative aminopeptidase FrvX